jgi:hypothetical protein
MRACSNDTAIEGLAGGGARSSTPSTPNRLASWVFLILFVTHQPNRFSGCVLIDFYACDYSQDSVSIIYTLASMRNSSLMHVYLIV